jgi:predicted RNase H-like HicB family nuclease
MKRVFTAGITQEGEWYVAQRLEVDVASQSQTEEEALVSLAEALTLAFSSHLGMRLPALRMAEIEVGGA